MYDLSVSKSVAFTIKLPLRLRSAIEMHNDLSCPFRELNSAHQKGLISQMIEIQNCILDNEKSMDWYQKSVYLTCDRLPEHQHNGAASCKDVVNPLQNTLVRQQCDKQVPMKSVLSVSYTWEQSQFEGQESSEFWVTDSGQSGRAKINARGSVVSRVLTYIKHSKAPGFWMDKDCIDQSDDAANKAKKQMAIQSMDLIYRFGEHSVAFLTTPIRTTFQARLLSKLMLDKWIFQQDSIGRIKLKRFVSMRKAQAMIALLEHILSDSWWTRAWTYHEESCASTKMVILLPHYPHVDMNQGYSFGKIVGEVEISAVKFRTQVTRFCLAYMRKQGFNWQEGTARCKVFLESVGQHKLINEFKKENDQKYQTGALTWRIISDLKHRRLQNAWEILAIIANCCGYSRRLDAEELQKLGCSLSSAVLALVLLNGDILRNDSSPRLSANVDLFELLTRLSFQNFESMVDVKEYTFLKRCRLPKVSLTHDGILTSGCIWRLHDRCCIPPVKLLHSQEISFQNTTLSEAEVEQLNVLCKYIWHKYPTLTQSIQNFIKQAQSNGKRSSLSLMVVMAQNIIRWIQLGKVLAIGSCLGRRDCHGVFAVSEASNHCFTAWQPRVWTEPVKADRYLEKSVSLEVEIVRSRDMVPHLRIQRWVAGLCFWDTTDQQKVLLPWSASLEQLEPCMRD